MSTIARTAEDEAVTQHKRVGVVRRPSGLVRYLPYIFILSLFIPLQFYIGPIRLSAYRVFLLLVIVPCIFAWLNGRAGRISASDLLVLAHTAWMAIALAVNHGISNVIEAAGIYFIEVMGCYLVARCYIRSAESFYAVMRTLFLCIVFLIPFSFIESVFGKNLLMWFFDNLGTVPRDYYYGERMGAERAHSVFEHPILYGVVCASALVPAYYVVSYGSRMFTACTRALAVATATMFSFSSGPLIALVIQVLISGWDHLTRTIRNRWWILGGLAGSMYVAIDILSNRTPFHVISTYLSFSTGSAYNRILIWHFGSAEVARHPFFGIGMNDWTRPSWMGDSMDNFWLVLAVRGGVPAFLFFAGAVLAMCIAVARVKGVDRRMTAYRRGWMIAIVGMAISASTVHLWNATFCLYIFLIGCMSWLLDQPEKRRSSPERQSIPRKAPAPRWQIPRPPTFG